MYHTTETINILYHKTAFLLVVTNIKLHTVLTGTKFNKQYIGY